jgi:tetratricopeptide (TPR) repeat protein
MRAAVIAPGRSTVLRQMSSLKFALEEPEEAVALALRALSLALGDRQNALHAGELLLRTGRFDEGADIIAGSLDTSPQDEVAFRLLSAAQMLRGRIEDALVAIDRALSISPERAEYHLHRANLLYRLGRLDEAAEAFGRAAALDPSNPDAKRSQLTVYFDSGRFTEALAVGGELIRAGKRRICASGIAGIEPPVRDLGRRFRRAQRALLATAPGTANASRILRETAYPRARRPRPGYP